MDKFKQGTFLTYMVVSAAVGAFASLIAILAEDILVLPFIVMILVGATVTTIVAGLAYMPVFLKLRQVTESLQAINRSKHTEEISTLPFGVLGELVEQANTLIENQVDFQSMRGRLYEQISEVAAQEERNRLARDLHDSIKQQVFSMNVSAAAAHAHLDNNPTAAREALLDVRQSAQEAMVEMRVLLQQLAPAPLEQSGLIESMRQQMEALSYRTGAKINTSFDKLPADDLLPLGAQETLFRITQEALSNVARHARARHVNLTLKYLKDEQTMSLTIADDGQGFDVEDSNRGMGLNNMERRVEDLDASLTMESATGEGTTLKVTVPLAKEETEAIQLEQRSSHKKLASEVYHQYIGVSSSVAGLIFAGTLIIRSYLNQSDTWITLLMLSIAGVSIASFRYFWKKYRARWQHFQETVPQDSPAYYIVRQHRYECHWIIWFAITFVVPGSLVGIEDFLWIPTMTGVILLVAIEFTMIQIIRYQHRYLKQLLPAELPEAMAAFRMSLISGVLATVLVAATVFLPGTSTGLYALPADSDQWDSNFFTSMVFVFTFYHVLLILLYGYWQTRMNQHTTTEKEASA